VKDPKRNPNQEGNLNVESMTAEQMYDYYRNQ